MTEVLSPSNNVFNVSKYCYGKLEWIYFIEFAKNLRIFSIYYSYFPRILYKNGITKSTLLFYAILGIAISMISLTFYLVLMLSSLDCSIAFIDIFYS